MTDWASEMEKLENESSSADDSKELVIDESSDNASLLLSASPLPPPETPSVDVSAAESRQDLADPNASVPRLETETMGTSSSATGLSNRLVDVDPAPAAVSAASAASSDDDDTAVLEPKRESSPANLVTVRENFLSASQTIADALVSSATQGIGKNLI